MAEVVIKQRDRKFAELDNKLEEIKKQLNADNNKK
jgi:hypothetical protein